MSGHDEVPKIDAKWGIFWICFLLLALSAFIKLVNS